MKPETAYLLTGGRLVDPAGNLDVPGDLLIENGTITGRGSVSPSGPVERVDCQGMVVAPGFLDLRCHLRDPGREDCETVETGTLAAVRGGFTGLAVLPDTKPVNESRAVTEYLHQQTKAYGACRIYPLGALTKGLKGEDLAEIGEMEKAGIAGVSNGDEPIVSAEMMRRAGEYLRAFNLPWFHSAFDPSLAPDGLMHEGRMATRLGIAGIPPEAEYTAVYRDLALAAMAGRSIHLSHLSTAGSLDLIRAAKQRGQAVTCDVSALHCLLTDDDLRTLDANLKVTPPLRSKEDRAAILAALLDGTVDAICTDHFPRAVQEKEHEFDHAEWGAATLETAVSALIDGLCHHGEFPFLRLAALLSTGPHRILNVPGGSLAKGNPAHVTVFDPHRSFRLEPGDLLGKSRNDPFLGKSFKGAAVHVFVDGRWVVKDREVQSDKY